MERMGDLAGRIILVTGAGKGSGRRLAEACAARGATVAANDISPINLEQTAAQILASGGRVKTYVEDIAKKMPVQALLNCVLDDLGRIDIVINCAEVEPLKGVLEMDDWDWQRTLDVNLSGAFLLTQSAGRIMQEKGGGTIMLLGARPKGPGQRAAYLASKAGLTALAETANTEFSGCGVRVLCIRTEVEALEACRP